MRVLLPAPFSPTTAWTSPRGTSKLTSERAATPGKVLVMCRSSMAWVMAGRRVQWRAPRRTAARPGAPHDHFNASSASATFALVMSFTGT